jgi:signal transduction histidine kinase
LWPQIAAQRGITEEAGVIFSVTGEILRWLGTLALTYAVSSYRVFDVRMTLFRWVGVVIQAIISALPVILAVFFVETWDGPWAQRTFFLPLGLFVIAFSFLFYQPLRTAVERLINRFLLGEKVDAGQVVRRYTQAIAPTLDVELLSQTLFDTLGGLMPINHGALVLVSRVEDGYDLEPIPAVGQIRRHIHHFTADTLFLTALARRHQPLLQYEMDFAPDFTDLSAEEREWLSELAVDVYVPISDGSRLVGIIAIGPKHTNVPYQPAELELMQILADQTVVALQNARLYRALGEQNEKIRQLNTSLVLQNERLEIMDRVKTDFITIASHELRTPLAQVKGYTDILSTLNDDRELTFRQLREIVGQVHRATDHLEHVISAMLDASQLDLAGVQLNFVTTTLEAVLELALEPLAEAMRERRIRYIQDGIEDLPSLEADLRRLSQAFGNVIGNAVKFTPDHGQISVTGSLVPGPDDQAYAEVTVADSGIGIDPRFHELIFEKFFRIGNIQFHSTGNTKFRGAGPGLGLPIARGIIAAHDGRIWVDSEGEDEERLPGTRFTIILPLKHEPQSAHGPHNGHLSHLNQAVAP